MPRDLTADDVRIIRTSPLSSSKLATQFGVNGCTIRRARHGQTWADHPTPPARIPRGGWQKSDLPCIFDSSAIALSGETWRPAVGWEEHYRVSDLGRVYSLHQTGRLITGMRVAGGYRVIKLRSQDREQHGVVHCMVLEAFRGPRPSPAHEGCHNDGNASNNALANLRWDTAVANQADRIKHGTSARDIDVSSKLTADRVREIRTNPAITVAEWAARFGCSTVTVGLARRGITWKHVNVPPVFKRGQRGVARVKALSLA